MHALCRNESASQFHKGQVAMWFATTIGTACTYKALRCRTRSIAAENAVTVLLVLLKYVSSSDCKTDIGSREAASPDHGMTHSRG